MKFYAIKAEYCFGETGSKKFTVSRKAFLTEEDAEKYSHEFKNFIESKTNPLTNGRAIVTEMKVLDFDVCC
jgi:hypothetical protein